MKIKTLPVLLVLSIMLASSAIQAQPIIDKNDMPDAGDTIRISQAAVPPGLNYQLADTNTSWDFSSLQPVNQLMDTFLSVLSTSPFYYPAFILNASIASNGPDLSFIPNVTLTDVYEFYKESNTAFTLVGYGASMSGVPLTPKYNPADKLYSFPITMGSVDSTTARLELAIPGLFTFSQTKKRKNTVDAWGNLTTPFGTFSTLRIKSEVIEIDSLYLDTPGIQVPLPHQIFTEYKWLADNMGVPVLVITKPQTGAATAEFIDSLRILNIGIEKAPIFTDAMNLYPNPTADVATLDFDSHTGEAELRIYGYDGSFICSRNVNTLPYRIDINDIGLKAGLYLIQICEGERKYNKWLVVTD